jgi:hypothetical protein
MLQAAAFQRCLIQSGYCVRGGIAIGDAFANSRTVFGPALIEAHEAERAAKHPRTVLAPSAVQHAAKHVTYYHPMSDAPQNEELLVDVRDQCVFLDYLTSGEGLYDDPIAAHFPADREKTILDHRLFVLANLEKQHGKIRAKYQWLAAYHNFVVRERVPTAAHIPRYRDVNRFAAFLDLSRVMKRRVALRR